MDRVLTLYFKYKDIGGNIGEYEPFATAVVDVEGREEAIKTNEWLTHLMELKIKSDSDVAGVASVTCMPSWPQTHPLEMDMQLLGWSLENSKEGIPIWLQS